MAATWLRLEARTAFVGWTARLPAEQYAAFIKFLQAVKMYGEHGEIQRCYFDNAFLASVGITRNSFDFMLKAGYSNEAFTLSRDGVITVSRWKHYQIDPTAADRQWKKRHGESRDTRDVTDVTTTGRDGTGRDNTRKGAARRSHKKPDPNPNHRPLQDHFEATWKGRFGGDYPHGGAKDAKAIQAVLRAAGNDLDRAKLLVDTYIASDDDPFIARNGHRLALMQTMLPALIAGASDDQNQHGIATGTQKRGRLR